MKLTAKAARELQSVLNELERAGAFIAKPDIVFARQTRIAMMPEHSLARKSDGETFAVLCKDIGSDLVGFDNARRHLASFIDRHTA